MHTEAQLESLEFRQHIRTLLYRYSKTHLTTDYVTFTEDLVSELLQDLRPIPLTDPYSFVVPVDPFQTFSQLHSLSSLQPYDEILPTTKEAIACIKLLTGSKPGPPITSRLDWTESTYEPLPEPFYPALTRQSRKTAPKLGKKTNQAHRDNFRTLTEIHGLVTTTIEPVPEEKLDIENILKVKCQIDPEELGAVKAVLKSTADAMRKQASYKNRYLEPRFLCTIDYNTFEAREEEFFPIFPRNRAYPPSGTGIDSDFAPALKNYADVLPLIDKEIEVEDLDGSVSQQHLVLVDGWETIQSSPPSTPSSKNTDSEDRTDQLFLESSPNTEPPLVEEIMKSKMGKLLSLWFMMIQLSNGAKDILIPRSRQIGGKSGVMPHILAGKTLQTFLQPLLSKDKNEPVHIFVEREEECRAPSTNLGSLVGQPASDVDVAVDANSSSGRALTQNCELNLDLERLYDGHGLDNMIMKETLYEKQDMLMEVPTLPEPNIHPPNEFHIPRNFAEFLVPSKKKEGETRSNQISTKPEVQYQFLKKVRGKQSLQLALSWVTFTVDERLPSVFELVGVNDLFQPCTATDEAEKLIQSMEIVNEHELRFSRGEDTLYSPPEEREEITVLLNRQERTRLAKMEGRCEENIMDRPDDNDDDQNIKSSAGSPIDDSQPKDTEEIENMKIAEQSSASREEMPPVIPVTLYDIDYLESPGWQGGKCENDDKLDEERPKKRPRLDMSSPKVYSDQNFDLSSPDSRENPSTIYYDSGYHSSGYFCEENKENYPPLSSSWPMQEEADAFQERLWGGDAVYDQREQVGYDPTAGESFEALSFDSTYLYKERNVNAPEYSGTSSIPQPENASTVDPRMLMGQNNHSTSSATPEGFSQLLLRSEPEIASHSLGISNFAGLRARSFLNPKLTDPPPPQVLPIASEERLRGVPKDLLDQNTIVLSGPVAEQQSVHRYMASLDFIQKRGLVRALRSKECAVELVERQTLSGVDLIIDPYCAVLFFSLFTLPSRCEAYVQRVAEQSWNFSNLLVVFEAYPDTLATRSKPRGSSTSDLNAYSPPVMKSIKKFRRDVSIADACGTKCAETKVQYAFADTVRDAALATRIFGTQAEKRDETSGVIWGERSWLAVDFVEEEERLLGGLRGMNHFSAAMVLCQISLEDFVQLLPEERLDRLCGLLSEEVINQCNADIERRLQTLHLFPMPLRRVAQT